MERAESNNKPKDEVIVFEGGSLGGQHRIQVKGLTEIYIPSHPICGVMRYEAYTRDGDSDVFKYVGWVEDLTE